MRKARLARVFACLVVVGMTLSVSVSGASASDASIKASFKSYNSKILIAEGHLATALGEYKTSHNATPVEEALSHSTAVVHSLEVKIARQAAGAPRVKEGKAKIVKGLTAVVVAYGQLKAAFEAKTASPEAAVEDAQKAELAVKKGRKELLEGVRLIAAR
jgi:hypothetical protein